MTRAVSIAVALVIGAGLGWYAYQGFPTTEPTHPPTNQPMTPQPSVPLRGVLTVYEFDRPVRQGDILGDANVVQYDQDEHGINIQGTDRTIKKYYYRGKAVRKDQDEVEEKRTPNSRTYQTGEDTYRITVVMDERYYKDKMTGNWYTIEFGTTTLGSFGGARNVNDIGNTSLFDKLRYVFATKRVYATTLNLQPDATNGLDVDIYDQQADTNRDDINENLIVGGDGSSTAAAAIRGLLKFSGISAIPAGSTIDSVTLVGNENADTTSTTIRIHRVLQNWVEDEATWNSYSTGNGWDSAGASTDGTDRVAATSDTYNSDSSASGDITLTGSGLVTDVQGWVDGTFANYGWLLAGEDAEGVHPGSANYVRWGSSNNSTAGNRPEITIDYTEGSTEEVSNNQVI